MPECESATSLACYLVQLTFFLNSKTFSMKEASVDLYSVTRFLRHHRSGLWIVRISKSPGPTVCHVRPRKVWHLLLSPIPYSTMLNLSFSAPATLTCLSASPPPRPWPPSSATPALVRNTQRWVSSRKPFYHHHHHPRPTSSSTLIVSYMSHVLYWSCCFKIIYLHSSPNPNVNSLKIRSVSYLSLN